MPTESSESSEEEVVYVQRKKPKPKKPKRLTRRQKRELLKFPHGRECFCGCRTGTLEGKKKKEGGAVYVMDDGRWRKKKSRMCGLC